MWRGSARRRDKPIADAVTAVARKDTCRGIVHYIKEGMREGRNPNSRGDKLQGHERTQSKVAKEPNQSRGNFNTIVMGVKTAGTDKMATRGRGMKTRTRLSVVSMVYAEKQSGKEEKPS
ncbi:hypothetical protein DY000_02031659 [Brassica cretica]|uniref:Uncharacterized protein n=1 Tax=Brassica cretica TaxID=69181 RepID=A0ABQ7DYY5_BRACR|nr:hypothetical protein DY000_02031659 [Brassica cretica]